jgi:hypothetical protein
VPTGFAISGNPITTSGTLALAFASGYSLPTNASQANWNTAYNDSITAFSYNTSTGVLTLTQQDAGTLTATVTLAPFTTTNLAEGTNLYFTTSRARQSLSAGTGISYDNSTGVITNSAPDQIVSLSAGTGISTTGTYPSFTITNTAPDQTVVLNAGTGITTSGTYPNFTITNSDRGSSQNIFKNIAVSGQSTIVADGNDDTLTVASGTGISLATNATSDTLTITNTAPDQTVVLTGAGTTVVTGTYPSFTITSNDQYVGTVTSVATSAPITGGTITTSGTIGITQSGTSSDGYLSSTDWNTFNSKVGGSGTTNYVAKFTGSGTIGNSQIFDNGTDVGIGTATPGSKLDILSSANPFITVRTASYAAVLGADTTNGYIRIGAATNHAVGTVVNGTIRTWLDTDGNLGINTTVPNAKLNVSGTAGSGSVTPQQDLVHVGGNELGGIGGYAGIRLAGTGSADYGVYIRGVKTTSYGNYWNDALTFSVTRTNTQTTIDEAMRITSDSNVGIGTIYPQNKLHVIGNIDTRTNNSTTDTNVILLNTYNGPPGGGGTNLGPGITWKPLYDGYSKRSAGIMQIGEGNYFRSALAFYTNNVSDESTDWSERMRITAGGNVGIGTSNPSAKLVVSSTGDAPYIIMNTSATGDKRVRLQFTQGGNSGMELGTDYSTNNGNNFYFYDRVNGTTLGFFSAGTTWFNANLGVGTTTPMGPLEVYSANTGGLGGHIILNNNGMAVGNETAILFNDSGTGSVSSVRAAISSTVEGAPYRGDLKFKTGSTTYGGLSTRMIITGAGNVGIGETAPSTLVHLNRSNADSLVTSTPSIIISNRNSTSGSFIGGGIFNNTYRDISTSSITAGIYFLNKNSVGAGALAKVSDIIFATGNYSTDWVAPDEKMRLTTDGLLGLGVSAPSYKLHISAGTDLIRITSSNTDARINIGHSGNGGYIGYANIGTGARNNVFYVTTGAGTIGSGFIVDNDGNVGIGTTSPVTKLHVAGNGAFTGISVTNPDTSGTFNRSSIDVSSNQITMGLTAWGQGSVRAGTAWVQTVNNYPLVLGTNDNEVMRLLTNGNVGIGTTGPTSKFQVNNNAGTGSAFYVDAGNPSGTTTLFEHTGANTPVAFAITKSGYSGSSVDFGILYIDMAHNVVGGGSNMHFTLRNSSGNRDEYGGLGASIVTNTAGATAGRLNFYTTNAGATRNIRMVVNPDGNVGIGTTSPEQKLQIGNGTATGSQYFRIFNSASDIYIGQSGGSIFGFSANSAGFILSDNSSFPFGIGTVFAQPFVIGTTNVERMRITSSGNVGIGTTAPGHLLTVQSGNLGLISNSYGSTGLIRIYGTDGLEKFQQGLTTGGDSYLYTFSGNNLIFYTNNGSERMRITSGGNVGIGTASPGTAYRLVVSTGVGQTGAIQTTGSVNIGTGALGVNVTPSATAGRIDASNDIVAYSTSDKRLKENIKPIENALEKVKSLTGVEFDWIEETKDVHGYEGHDVGVIAQEVQAVLPEAIRTNESGYLSVRYEKIIGLLVEAMKEQQKEIDELKKLIK